MGINNRARKIAEGNKRSDLTTTKESFLHLCRMYEAMGVQLRGLPKEEGAQRVIAQYYQMGEQMKHLGMGLDALGGFPVLKPKPPPIGGNGEKRGG